MCQSRGITRRIFDDATVQFKCIRYDADATQVGEVLSDGVGEDELAAVVQQGTRGRVVYGVDLGACLRATNAELNLRLTACGVNNDGFVHADGDADLVASIEVRDCLACGRTRNFDAACVAQLQTACCLNLCCHSIDNIARIRCSTLMREGGISTRHILDRAAV